MQNNPILPMFVYADDQTSDHTTEITFLQIGRAAHRIARALRPLERGGEEGQVVMLIANCDTIFFQVIVAGMFIAGSVVSVPARLVPGKILIGVPPTSRSWYRTETPPLPWLIR